MHTYNFDSVSRCGCDVPGALFPAGVLVWPVWAAQGPTGTVDLMLTLGWRHTHTQTQEHTQRGSLKIMAAQEKVRGNGKGTGRRETQELNERRRFQRSTSW